VEVQRKLVRSTGDGGSWVTVQAKRVAPEGPLTGAVALHLTHCGRFRCDVVSSWCLPWWSRFDTSSRCRFGCLLRDVAFGGYVGGVVVSRGGRVLTCRGGGGRRWWW